MKKLLKIAGIICAFVLGITIFVGCGEAGLSSSTYDKLTVGDYLSIADISDTLGVDSPAGNGVVTVSEKNYGCYVFANGDKNTYVVVYTQNKSQASTDWKEDPDSDGYDKREHKLKIVGKTKIEGVAAEYNRSTGKTTATYTTAPTAVTLYEKDDTKIERDVDDIAKDVQTIMGWESFGEKD